MNNSFDRLLNRSHSESEICKTITYSNDSVSHLGIPMIRKSIHILEEIYFYDPRTTETTFTQPLRVINQQRNENVDFRAQPQLIHQNSKESKETFDQISTPMDVDDDVIFVKEEQCEDKPSCRFKDLEMVLKQRSGVKKEASQSLKEYPVSNKTRLTRVTKVTEPSKSNLVKLIIFVSIILALCVYFELHKIMFVNSDVRMANIKDDLHKNIFEQDDSVMAVVESLEQSDNWPEKLKVLVFVGTQGLGKTYIANILKDHFTQYLSQDIISMRLKDKDEQNKVFKSLSSFNLNLIVVDDLSLEHVNALFEFVHSVPKNYQVLIIAIFKLYDIDDNLKTESNMKDLEEIKKVFAKAEFHNKIVVFKQFDVNQAEKWVLNKLKSVKVPSEDSHNKIVKHVLSGHNVKRHGLKGLYSKLLVEVQKKKNNL